MAARLDRFLSSAHPDIAIAAALLFVAGLIDAIAFFVLKGSFVAFMSGNSTIMGASAAAGRWSTIALVAGLVVAFFSGAAGGAAISRWGGNHAPVWILGAVTGALLAGTVVALTASPTAGMVVVAVATGAINSALSHTSTVQGGLTYVTGTLVRSAHELVASLGTDRPWAWVAVFWMWPVFVLGAVCGGFAERHWGVAGLWAGVLIAACALLLRVVETSSRGNSRSEGTERAAG
ncbi:MULTISPECIES: YoaK family protein [Gordonia]|uniref:YoaK family protein n=1 Tax=Gordonia TaxID=2053 RepID=UPI0033912B5A